jgi:hypothetical protein
MINKQSNIASNSRPCKNTDYETWRREYYFPWDFEFSEDKKDYSTAPKAHHPTLILFIMNSENSKENQIFISNVKYS